MADGLTNKNVVVRATVTDRRTGAIRFIDGSKDIGINEWKCQEAKAFPDGTLLECHFSVSSNNSFRQMVFCRPLENGEKLESRVIEDKMADIELFPEWFEGHYFDDEMRLVFGLAKKTLTDNEFMSIIMRGGSGYGKSTAFKKLAKAMEFDFLKVDCAAITDPEAWFGIHRAKDGSTSFEYTSFTKALMGGHHVILLDEANRLESWLSNTLFPILDDSKQIEVAGENIQVNPPILFAMTVNEGVQFSGTFNLDAALRNRADIALIARPLPEAIEIKLVVDAYDIATPSARRLVSIIRQMRQVVEKDGLFIDVSTRTLLKIARLMSKGASMEQAFTLTIINNADSDDSKAIIDIIKVS